MRKYFPLFIILLAFVVYQSREVLLAPFVTTRPDAGTGLASETEAVDPGEAEAPVPDLNVTHGEIKRGQPFYVAMEQAGLTPVEIQNIVRASKTLFDFKRVKPGQEYLLFTSDDGIDSLHYTIDSENILKVAKIGETVEARRDTVPYVIEHYVTSGTITSSIYETLLASDADPELASYLAIIFQWDIDFFKDIRKGDTFTILYEKKTFADGKTELGNVRAARIYTQGREHYAVAYRSDGILNYYDTEGKSLQKSLLRAPMRYSRISSNFTYKRLHPVTHTYKAHLGVDYVAPIGTPVHSTGNGTVVTATRDRANGNYVKIRHNSRYTTYYLHLKGFARGIRSGAHVQQGQVIGYLGGTGLVNGPHLDYRIKVDGRFVNPRTIRLPSKEPVPADQIRLFQVTRDACLLRFYETGLDRPTVAVRAPTPPLQDRIAPVF